MGVKMENNELQSIRKQMAELEERISRLESLIDGSSNRKPGRKSKLSSAQKNEIIRKHEEGSSYSILAEEYQVSRSTICNICRGHNPMIIDKVYRNSTKITVQTYKSAK